MLGVVVIGRNEGERLLRCLRSLSDRIDSVVYVDSGSTDGSVAVAASLGAEIAELDACEGFTAARARNLGFAILSRRVRPPRYVQFVDGDCEIRLGWIDTAMARLDAELNLAVVAGRRHERDPDASIFNRLCDMEWNTPIGDARAVGGDAMYRSEAFASVGGFESSLICGEEPDLCFRLREKGWRIARIDAEMTLHDAAITRWSQWARRTMRGGWAYAEGAARHRASTERYNRRQLRSIVTWGALVPFAALSLGGTSIVLAQAGLPSADVAAGGVLGIATLYVIMILRIASNRHQHSRDPWRHALLFGGMIMLGKIPESYGVWRFYWHGDIPTIIEYK